MSETIEFDTRRGTQVTLIIKQSDINQTQAVITAHVDDDRVPEQEVKPREALFNDHGEPYEIVMHTNRDDNCKQATIPLDAKTHDKIDSVINLVTEQHTKTEEEALEEARETGEPVQIGQERTTGCNDRRKECDIDHVRTMAFPDGEIKEERVHSY